MHGVGFCVQKVEPLGDLEHAVLNLQFRQRDDVLRGGAARPANLGGLDKVPRRGHDALRHHDELRARLLKGLDEAHHARVLEAGEQGCITAAELEKGLLGSCVAVDVALFEHPDADELKRCT